MKQKSVAFSLLSLIVVGILHCNTYAETRIISVNFSGGENNVSTGKFANDNIGYGEFAVEGSKWMDCASVGGEDFIPHALVPLEIKDNMGDTAPYANVKFYLCSAGHTWGSPVFPKDGNTQMLKRYLDNGVVNSSHPEGTDAGFKLTGLPTKRYTVVVYFGGDEGQFAPICAYQINNTYYKGSPQGTILANPNESWGDAATQTVLDPAKNTLIVSNIIANAITVQASIYNQSRGRISGFQIVMEDIPASYQAELTGNALWGSKEGIGNPSQNWVNGLQSSIILTNGLSSPASFTFDEDIQTAFFKLTGGGETILKKSGEAVLDIPIYDLSEAEKTTFKFNTGDSSVNVGHETVFEEAGSGNLNIDRGKTAVWNGFVWGDSGFVINNGTIKINGGSQAEPLIVTSSGMNTKVGRYLICNNSCLKVNAKDGNKFFLIDGEGVKESTLILASTQNWGVSQGTCIRNVKTRLGTEHDFRISCSGAMDGSVWLDSGAAKLIIANNSSLTLGGLTGTGPIVTDGNIHNLSINMAFGPMTYAGAMDKINLMVGGTNELTLTAGRTKSNSGNLTIAEGAKVTYDAADKEVYIQGSLKGAGTLTKYGTGTLTLAGDNSDFTGNLTIAGGDLVISGKTMNVPTAITGETTGITIGCMDNQNPVLDLTSIPEGENKIPLVLVLNDAVLLSGKTCKIIKFSTGISADKFEIRVTSDLEGLVDLEASTYKMAIIENVLTICPLVKSWSGSFENGNGEWSTQSEALCWNNKSAIFNHGDKVTFGEIQGKNPIVTVIGILTTESIGLSPGSSLYTFNPAPDAVVELAGMMAASSGETIFNVPLRTVETSDIWVGTGTKLCLGAPFGTDVVSDSTEAFYTKALKVEGDGILTLAPGEGKTQKIKLFDPTSEQSTCIVSNGTVIMTSGGDRGAFYKMNFQIDQGGTVIFDESVDVSGYGPGNKNRPIVINKGGKLCVKKRDSLMRGINLNGGSLAISGKEKDCAIKFHGNLVVKVTKDSQIVGRAGGTNWDASGSATIDNPVAFLFGEITFDVSGNATLTNAVTYGSDKNESSSHIIMKGTGTMIQNGMPMPDGKGTYPLVYVGKTKVFPGSTYKLNCEHQNIGNYEIHTGSCLCGDGVITGPGKVILGINGGNAKLCGGLTIKSLTVNKAPSNLPMQFGESSPISVKVTGTLTAEEGDVNIRLNNGSFTVGKECDATGFASAKFTITELGTLSVEAGGKLKLSTAPILAENSTLRIGADYSGEVPLFSDLSIGTAIDIAGVAFEVDIQGGKLKGNRIPLLTAPQIDHVEQALTEKLPAGRKWKYVVHDNLDGTFTLYAEVKSGFAIFIR